MQPGQLAAAEPKIDKNYDLAGLDVFRKTIVQIKDNYVDPSRIDPKEMFTASLEAVERQVAEYVRKNWGVAVFATEVGTNSKILEAGSVGVSVFHYVGAEKAMDTYLALADEVMARA